MTVKIFWMIVSPTDHELASLIKSEFRIHINSELVIQKRSIYFTDPPTSTTNQTLDLFHRSRTSTPSQIPNIFTMNVRIFIQFVSSRINDQNVLIFFETIDRWTWTVLELFGVWIVITIDLFCFVSSWKFETDRTRNPSSWFLRQTRASPKRLRWRRPQRVDSCHRSQNAAPDRGWIYDRENQAS